MKAEGRSRLRSVTNKRVERGRGQGDSFFDDGRHRSVDVTGGLGRFAGCVSPIRSANVTDWEGQDAAARAFLDTWLHQARVVVLHLLGGKRAHPSAVERIVSYCQQHDIPLLAWPGEQEPDPELLAASNVPLTLAQQAMRYVVNGGVKNFQNLFRMVSDTWLGTTFGYEEPEELPWTGIYRRGSLEALDMATWSEPWTRGGRWSGFSFTAPTG